MRFRQFITSLKNGAIRLFRVNICDIAGNETVNARSPFDYARSGASYLGRDKQNPHRYYGDAEHIIYDSSAELYVRDAPRGTSSPPETKR